MESAALRLDADARDADALESLFREAHSLKGTARMAGADELGGRAHALEDRLAAGRAGQGLDAGALLQELDELRALLAHATNAPAAQPRAGASASQRVEPRHLDDLLAHAGELSVLRRVLDRRLDALAQLAGAEGVPASLASAVADVRDAHARIAATTASLDETVRVLRLATVGAALQPLHRVVRDVAAECGKRARFEVEGGDTRIDRSVVDEVKDALMHLVRNAVDHGIETPEARRAKGKDETGFVRIRVRRDASHVVIEVEDDGRGFDVEAIRETAIRRGLATREALDAATREQVIDLVFAPGFTTASRLTSTSGRGVGLDVVRERVRALKGSLRVEDRPGAGARVRLHLPAAAGVERALLVRAAGRAFAIPLDAVEQVERVSATFAVPTLALSAVLSLGATPDASSPGVLVTLASGDSRAGVLVDEVAGEGEVLVRPHTRLLRRVPHVAGATLLESGEVCIVLHPDDIVRTVAVRAGGASSAAAARPSRILVVEDSPSIRARIVRALTLSGYEVSAAGDGLEGLALAATGEFDAALSDVEMPRMDGFAFVERLRADPRYAAIPVILVTSRSAPEDRARAARVGADALVAKGTGAVGAMLAELRARLSGSA